MSVEPSGPGPMTHHTSKRLMTRKCMHIIGVRTPSTVHRRHTMHHHHISYQPYSQGVRRSGGQVCI